MRPLTTMLVLSVALAASLFGDTPPKNAAQSPADRKALSAQEVRDTFKELTSRNETTRLFALERLANASNDLSQNLKDAFASKSPVRKLSALDVVAARPEYVSIAPLAELLGDEDASLACKAQRVHRVLGVTVIDGTFKAASAWQGKDDMKARALARNRYEARYAAALALTTIAAAPGYFEGQYGDLLKQPEWGVAALSDILVLAAGVEDPLKEAVYDLSQRAKTAQEFSFGYTQVLHHSGCVPMIVRIIRGECEQPPADDGSALDDTAALVHQIRIRAAQALAALSANEAALAALDKSYTDEVARPIGHISRPSDEVLIEIELGLARCGKTSVLDTRITALRGRIVPLPAGKDTSGGSEDITAASRLTADAEVNLETRRNIARLLLRSGRLDDAIAEYQTVVDKLQALCRTDATNALIYGTVLQKTAYNLACAQSLKGKQDAAFESIKLAVSCGYSAFDWILLDGDLAALRKTDDFVLWFIETAPPYQAEQLRHQGIATGSK